MATSPSTIPRLFLDRVAASADARAWSSFADGAWHDFTWRDYEDRARDFGLGLVAAGLKRLSHYRSAGEVLKLIALTAPPDVRIGVAAVLSARRSKSRIDSRPSSMPPSPR